MKLIAGGLKRLLNDLKVKDNDGNDIRKLTMEYQAVITDVDGISDNDIEYCENDVKGLYFAIKMFNETIDINCKRDIDEQHSELIALKNYQANAAFKYNKVLISDNDKIIPTKSQIAFWGIEPNLKGGHCPFFQIKKWSELL